MSIFAIPVSDGLGEETVTWSGYDSPNALVPFVRWQESEDFV